MAKNRMLKMPHFFERWKHSIVNILVFIWQWWLIFDVNGTTKQIAGWSRRASPEEQIHIYQVDNGQLHAREAENLVVFNPGVWMLQQSQSDTKGSKCLGLLVLSPLYKAERSCIWMFVPFRNALTDVGLVVYCKRFKSCQSRSAIMRPFFSGGTICQSVAFVIRAL